MLIHYLASPMHPLIGQYYDAVWTKRTWELQFEDILLIIFNTGLTRGQDFNLVGVGRDLNIQWVAGGVMDGPDRYDGVTAVSVRNGQIWVHTWCCFRYRIDYRTGEKLEQEFTK
jgi:hypothetical protein